MRRREFITLLSGAAVGLPLAARAQQPTLPVVALIRDGSADTAARNVAAFRKGLNETGYVEGQNVTVEYHWLEGQYDRMPSLMADLVGRRVAPSPALLRLQPKPRLPQSRLCSSSAKTPSVCANEPERFAPG